MCLIVSLYFSVYQLHVLSKAVRSSKAGFGECGNTERSLWSQTWDLRWSWAHCLTSLSLSILVCEMGIMYMSASRASIKHVAKCLAYWRCSRRACMLTCCLLGNPRLCLFSILCISLHFCLSLPSDFLRCIWTVRSVSSLRSDHELFSFLPRVDLWLLASVFYQSRK